MKIGCCLFAVMGDEWRTPLARIIALGAFDLDDLCPKIGQCLSGKRARKDPRQFDNLQTCKRLHVMSFNSNLSLR